MTTATEALKRLTALAEAATCYDALLVTIIEAYDAVKEARSSKIPGRESDASRRLHILIEKARPLAGSALKCVEAQTLADQSDR